MIESPRLPWWLILNLIILVIRPPTSAAAYRKIWTEQGSPLLINSRAISDKLQERFATTPKSPVAVELAMTYGEPSIAAAIDKLIKGGAQRVLTLPLYPQYSGTTSASVFDHVTHELGKYRRVPEARFINDYHDAPAYISALAASIRASWASGGRGNKLLMSFHGIPKRYIEKGDPYFDQCQRTAWLLADELELADDDWMLSFQSRVGRDEWLGPYTDETARELGRQGLAQLDVVCPGFSTDCLETLEEIAMQNAELFVQAGGGTLRYIAALNDSEYHLDCLEQLLRRNLDGWANSDRCLSEMTPEQTLSSGVSA